MILMLAWARSGGTLLNRILGAHSSLAVFSEIQINGRSSRVFPGKEFYKDFLWQATFWHKFISIGEYMMLRGRKYSDQLCYVEKKSAIKGKRIVVREWVTGDFAFNRNFRVREYLKFVKSSNDRIFILIRNPLYAISSDMESRPKVCQYSDKRSSFITAWCENWRRFHEEALELTNGIFYTYEDLSTNPLSFIKRLSNDLQIEFEPSCLTGFHKVSNYFGDRKGKDLKTIKASNRLIDDILAKGEVEYIEKTCADVMKRFGF